MIARLRHAARRLAGAGSPRNTGRTMAVLTPEGRRTGLALLLYGTPVYERLRLGKPLDASHVSGYKNFQLARVLLDLGYQVDVAYYDDYEFRPARPYEVVIDVESHLEIVARHVSADCLKILCPTFGHWSVHNTGNYIRHLNLLQRRGVAVKPTRLVRPNLAVEAADHILCPGGSFATRALSYRHTPLTPIAQVTPFTLDDWIRKDVDACRYRFVWLSGSGPVHKGLDLVLEAFATMPHVSLTVCGSFANARDFEALYHKELYETANIETVGWMDTQSERFASLAGRSIAVVHASVSEMSCTSIIGCMAAGLIPVGTPGNDIDMEDFGVEIHRDSVEGVRGAILELTQLPARELAEMSERTWQAAHARYGRARFVRDIRRAMCQLTGRSAPIFWEHDEGEIRIPRIELRMAPR